MKGQPNKTERIHSLDSLRAIMMLLGLVLHSTLVYCVTDYGAAWTLKDPNTTSLFNDYIYEIIHVFRMPLFFIVAGFFGALLFYERTPRRMIKNRISRVILPFIVFLIILWPTVVFCFGYTKLLFRGSNSALVTALSSFSNIKVLIPKMTFHLWFLYYLFIISIVSAGIGLLLKKTQSISSYISKAFDWIIRKPILRVVIFAGLNVLVYLIMGTYSAEASTSFIPNFNLFFYYLFFYLIGWVLFKSKHLLNTMMKFDWFYTILAVILFSIYFFKKDSFSYEVHIVLKSIVIWLFVFGITGLFIRYGSNYSARMRYISDSSYWVYLIHISLIAIIPSFIVDWPIHAILKFLIVLISTAIICFTSYHYLVRGTFIGKFLNGRKYPRKLSDIKKTEELSKLKLRTANN